MSRLPSNQTTRKQARQSATDRQTDEVRQSDTVRRTQTHVDAVFSAYECIYTVRQVSVTTVQVGIQTDNG